MHAAFLDYVKQVLMPTPIPGDSVIKDNSVDRRLVAIVSGITNVSFGSTTDSDGCPHFRPLLGDKQTSNSGGWRSVPSQNQTLTDFYL
jgi:hypothetical protein